MTPRVLVLALLIVLVAPAASADETVWQWPLGDRRVSGAFDLPDEPYAAGHRGIDLPGAVGGAVRAVAPGRVTFAGTIAGVGVVTVDHGGERSTYQPVRASVRRGDALEAGDLLGRLVGHGSHCASACLHLGRLRGKDYLDPLERLDHTARFRLVDPDGPPPHPPTGGDGSLRRPVGGPVTSPLGTRVHPVTGVRKLHDGTDFGAACGTPVRAAADGVVVGVPSDRAYGNRVVIRHGGGLETSYNHLSRQSVRVGQHVTPSITVGRVGRTGLATGCHLHFMVTRGGRPTDPMSLL
ncbi:peptidoglycan DD-metalloendopeptidase family protein [Aeromicrobium terrae]|uniref:peptidoglycan DD-metalloendopeptidase family protein n=1 Tax=Aeromicrobium terrae TaxID=2498846 RepID=UPI001C9CC776|nr:peptidoglycan DD-metalloendopeptidase family protein [Aeromicrobium terrae]